MKAKRYTIDLNENEVEALQQVAAATNAYARTGPKYGRPSWRSLVREIAAGRITCKDKLRKP